MDDTARYYIGAGITEAEDVFNCKKCGASVMPWFLGCESCGDPFPSHEPLGHLFECTQCSALHKHMSDAEQCCEAYCSLSGCGYDNCVCTGD